MKRRVRALWLPAAALLLGAGLTAWGQDGPPPGGPPPDMGGPMHEPGHGPMRGGPHEGGWMRGGLQLGPPGRWWDDDGFAGDLGLSADQRKRMDAIFNENRGQLQAGYHNLHGEELQMETLTRAKVVDEAALDAEIDRIAQARAALEKANSHMLLQIRREMTPDQILRLDAHRP